MSKNDQAATLRKLATNNVVPLDTARRRVISVTGGKGGVGKSTISVNLAVAYAKRGGRTLALDGDLGMADLNLLLGLAPSKSLLDVLQGCPIDEVLLQAHGISLLPALNGSYQLANLDKRSRHALLGVLEALSNRFDTLIMDIAAGIGENAMTLAGSAADIVVVTTPEPLSLADAYACLKVLATRQGVTRAFLLPNAVRSPSEAEEMVSRLGAIVDRFLGITLTALPPVPFDPTIAVAAAAGVPLVIHSPDSPASRAIRKVVQHLEALAQGEDRSQTGGLWATPQADGDQEAVS